MLPFGIGSPQSKELLNAIITCKNLDIYRTEIIQNFILKKWGVISLYVYLYTALLWGNILVIYFALKTELSIFYYIVLLINIKLLIWEAIQFSSEGKNYFFNL